MNNQDILVTLTPNAVIKTTIAPTTEIKVTVASSGPRGAMGPAASTTIFNQMSPLAIWTITHNLEKFPSVTIVDSSGNVVIGDIIYLNNMQIRITFVGAFSGKAYLN